MGRIFPLLVTLSMLLPASLASFPTVTFNNTPPPPSFHAQYKTSLAATVPDISTLDASWNREHLEFCSTIQQNGWEGVQQICKNKSHKQLFNDFSYYANPYYLHIISQQPGYEDFIINLHEQYTGREKHKHKKRTSLRQIPGFLYPNQFLKLIDHEYERITALRQERHHQQQKQAKHREAQNRLEQESYPRLQTNNRHDYNVFIKQCKQRLYTPENRHNEALQQRYVKRVAAAQQTLSKPHAEDYSARIAHRPPWQGLDADAFNRCCYGTPLDQLLHEELSDTQSQMHKLTLHFPASDYPQIYALLVYHCTVMAKKESNIATAFSLSDFAYDLVRIINAGVNLIARATSAAGKGFAQGVQKVINPHHWGEIAESLLHLGIFLADEHSRLEELDQALYASLICGDSSSFIQKGDAYQQHRQKQMETLGKSLQSIKAMPWEELIEHGVELGTTFILDGVALKAATLCASSSGRALIRQMAEALNSSRANETVVEVAGIGKIVLEQGVETASKTSNVIAHNSMFLTEESCTTQAMQKIAQGLTESAGTTVWDFIKMPGEMYPNTRIPKFFELTVGKHKFWVTPNATEHMFEYIEKARLLSHSMPINSQQLLASFKASLEAMLKQGIMFTDKPVTVGNWELMLSPSRGNNLLPAVKHAVYKPYNHS